MERVYTIGADTHCAFTELATVSPGGRLVRRDRCPTTIQALVQAVAKVGRPRVVIIEENFRFCGVGAELSDRICRHCFDSLDAPVERVTSLEIPLPYANSLEKFVLPSIERAREAVRKVMYL